MPTDRRGYRCRHARVHKIARRGKAPAAPAPARRSQDLPAAGRPACNASGGPCYVLPIRSYLQGTGVGGCLGCMITLPGNSPGAPMIKVSVMYPNTPGSKFNHEYYRDKHMPMVKSRMGENCKFYTV